MIDNRSSIPNKIVKLLVSIKHNNYNNTITY